MAKHRKRDQHLTYYTCTIENTEIYAHIASLFSKEKNTLFFNYRALVYLFYYTLVHAKDKKLEISAEIYSSKVKILYLEHQR